MLVRQHIRIVSRDNVEWKRELTRYGMSKERVHVLRHHVMQAGDSLIMNDEMRSKGNVSKNEALLVVHCLEHAHNAHSSPPPPPKSLGIVTTHYAQMLWVLHCVWVVGHKLHGDVGYKSV